jgi:hypothetical protein
VAHETNGERGTRQLHDSDDLPRSADAVSVPLGTVFVLALALVLCTIAIRQLGV